jgi:hypothetical protein
MQKITHTEWVQTGGRIWHGILNVLNELKEEEHFEAGASIELSVRKRGK